MVSLAQPWSFTQLRPNRRPLLLARHRAGSTSGARRPRSDLEPGGVWLGPAGENGRVEPNEIARTVAAVRCDARTREATDAGRLPSPR